MSKLIASLYAAITADTKQFQKGLKDAKGQVKDLGATVTKENSSWKTQFRDTGTSIMAAAGIVGGFAAALKGAYDIAKQGAALELSERKFQRLSKVIGTTADALMVDLREATKGTLSDAQLMQSATDLMGLGLVKTHDQTVRLATVVGGLGMDMNQLVLTLANQTTMRFDQLGVSIDGFDKRLNKLKKSGMNANDAFTEAFLQQAEAQLTKVGSAADTTAGSFMRLETVLANQVDALKKKLTPALANAADAMVILLTASGKIGQAFEDQKRQVLKTTGTYADYYDAAISAAIAAGKLRGDPMALAYYRNNREELDKLIGSMGIYTRAEYYDIKATQEQREAFLANRAAAGRMIETLDGYKIVVDEASKANEKFTGNIGHVTEAYQLSADAGLDYIGTLRAAAEAQDQLKEAQISWKESAGENIAGMLKENTWNAQRYEEGLRIIDEVQGTNLLTTYQLRDAQKQLADKYNAGKISGEQFKEELIKINDQFMPLDTSIQKSTQLLDTLLGKLNDFSKTWVATVRINAENPSNVNWSGNKNTTPSASPTAGRIPENWWETKQSGGPVIANSPYLVGERGPELFIPNVSGNIIPNGATKMGDTYNYYLTVQTIQSAQVVQKSFSTMRILSGV